MSTQRSRLGIVTIGQAPRTDLHEDLGELLAPSIDVVERGALDGLTLEEIELRYPVGEQSHVLVSRMRDGRQVTIAEPDLEPLLDGAIRSMAASGSVDALLVLCTGDLPDYRDLGIPVLSPKRLVRHGLQALFPEGRLLVMSPEARQMNAAKARWEEAGFHVDTLCASPYGEDTELERAASEAAALQGDLLYLDCMGYTLAQRGRIAALSGHQTLTPRQLVFSAANLLLG
ncbi:AroM family protein [Halomonas dongshanensis]|uniref:AroM family protein n=1 Tax=Halomonas dongshanensis TaxID=2890835 RepID=A0ABT2EA99_9GAMM|nr:AroM family protein [Halomonas dongshanensis]MCS2608475.1 AroM family protein [Halomonas dongshanensis]